MVELFTISLSEEKAKLHCIIFLVDLLRCCGGYGGALLWDQEVVVAAVWRRLWLPKQCKYTSGRPTNRPRKRHC